MCSPISAVLIECTSKLGMSSQLRFVITDGHFMVFHIHTKSTKIYTKYKENIQDIYKFGAGPGCRRLAAALFLCIS